MVPFIKVLSKSSYTPDVVVTALSPEKTEIKLFIKWMNWKALLLVGWGPEGSSHSLQGTWALPLILATFSLLLCLTELIKTLCKLCSSSKKLLSLTLWEFYNHTVGSYLPPTQLLSASWPPPCLFNSVSSWFFSLTHRSQCVLLTCACKCGLPLEHGWLLGVTLFTLN